MYGHLQMWILQGAITLTIDTIPFVNYLLTYLARSTHTTSYNGPAKNRVWPHETSL